MGAETACYVKVAKLHYEWIQMNEVTLTDAEEKAKRMPDVVLVVESSYDEPDDYVPYTGY